jgi:hypothetical protein
MLHTMLQNLQEINAEGNTGRTGFEREITPGRLAGRE